VRAWKKQFVSLLWWKLLNPAVLLVVWVTVFPARALLLVPFSCLTLTGADFSSGD
jgi:hypothetical protein